MNLSATQLAHSPTSRHCERLLCRRVAIHTDIPFENNRSLRPLCGLAMTVGWVLLLVAFLLSLISCGPVECIDADNWGNQYQMTIQSQGNGTPYDIPDPSDPTKSSGLQYTDWDSKYQLTGNGEDVIMVVNNSSTNIQQTVGNIQCGIFDYTNSWDSICVQGDPSLCANSPAITDTNGLAQFSYGGSCPFCGRAQCGGEPSPPDINSCTVPVSGVPARFYMGMGLYATVCDDGGQPDPKRIACYGNNSVHVGDNACTDPQSVNCSPFYQYNCPVGWARLNPQNAGDALIYLKILDRYYSDNNGAYTVTFKQGVKDSTPHAISRAANIVMSKLCVASETAYKNIVKGNDFIMYLRVLLILYIVLLGIAFIFGITEMNAKELVVSVFKIAIIQQLISPDSWEFFSQKFFFFFQNGVNELVSLMYGGSATSITQTGITVPDKSCIPNVAAFDQIDAAILKLFSRETTAKIISVFWTSFWGFLFVIVLYVAIFFILISIAKAIVLFIGSYVAISLLIILAPLFIPFMLFKGTADLFQNWVKQLISYFIQPLVVLAFVFFMLQLVNNEMDRMIGYRVCWKPWFSILGKDVYAWQPDYDDSKACMFTPNAILDKDGSPKKASEISNLCVPAGSNSGAADVCNPYKCAQTRYLGYPYLNTDDSDPDNNDLDRISQLQTYNIVSFLDVLLFILMIHFIRKFSETVPELAKHLAQAGTSQTDLGGVAGGVLGATVGKGLGLAKKGAGKVLDKAYYKASGRELKGDYRRARAVLGEMGSMVKDTALWAPKKIYSGLNKVPLMPLSAIKKVAPIAAKLPLMPAKLLGKVASFGLNKVASGITKKVTDGEIEKVDVAHAAKATVRAVLKAPVQAVLHKDPGAFKDVGKDIKQALKDKEHKSIGQELKEKLAQTAQGIVSPVVEGLKGTQAAMEARKERVKALGDAIKGFAGASGKPEASADEAAPAASTPRAEAPGAGDAPQTRTSTESEPARGGAEKKAAQEIAPTAQPTGALPAEMAKLAAATAKAEEDARKLEEALAQEKEKRGAERKTRRDGGE